MWRLLRQRRTFLTVEPVCLVYMLASFFSYSVFQELLRTMVCQLAANCTAASTNTTRVAAGCNVTGDVDRSVEAESSHWLLYFNVAYGLPSILVCLLYGGISDLIGRKPFIVLPIVGNLVITVVMVAVVYSYTMSLYYFLVGGFVAGLLGNFAIFNLATYSYVADISSRSNRTLQIGVLEAMTYLGATLSGLLGSFWLSSGGFGPPLAFVVGLDLLAIAYVFLAVPETRVRSSHKALCSSLARDVVANVVDITKATMNSWRMVSLLLVFFVVELNFLGITDTVILYTLGEPLCWSYNLVGYFLAASVFLNGIVSLFVLPLLTWMKVQDTSIVLVGLVAGAGGLVVMSMASKSWLMFLAPVVGALRGGVVPCVRSMLSKLSPAEEQGLLFSGVGVVESICTLCASALYNALFPVTQRVTPGFCFAIMAMVLIIPCTLTVILHCHQKMPAGNAASLSHSSDEAKPLLNKL